MRRDVTVGFMILLWMARAFALDMYDVWFLVLMGNGIHNDEWTRCSGMSGGSTVAYALDNVYGFWSAAGLLYGNDFLRQSLCFGEITRANPTQVVNVLCAISSPSEYTPVSIRAMPPPCPVPLSHSFSLFYTPPKHIVNLYFYDSRFTLPSEWSHLSVRSLCARSNRQFWEMRAGLCNCGSCSRYPFHSLFANEGGFFTPSTATPRGEEVIVFIFSLLYPPLPPSPPSFPASNPSSILVRSS